MSNVTDNNIPVHLYIDGDVLVYRAAFANEMRAYKSNGQQYATKKEAILAYPNITPELIQFHNDRSAVESTVYSIIKTACTDTNAKAYTVYLSDESGNNFRKKMYPAYKVNRKSFVRPVHYEYVRELLFKRYQAKLVVDLEADDALGIAAKEPGAVIASIDKDLLMVPGLHYNMVDRTMIKASDPGTLTLTKDKAGSYKLTGTGRTWHHAQMLLGDPIDNIIGIKGLGPKKVYELLHGKEFLHQLKIVMDQYAKANRPIEDLSLNSKLLWILREAPANEKR